MAETLVLAELSIDSKGVVSGVAVAGGALDGLGRKTEDAGKKVATSAGSFDLLTKRMFNLRTAAVALVGSFSLAGVLFGIRALVGEIIAGDVAFKEFQKSAKGVTAEFGALVRETFNVTGGLQSMTSWMDRIQASMLALRQAEEAHPAAMAAGRQGIIGAVFFGIPGAAGIISSLETIGSLWDKLTKKQQDAIKKSREGFREAGDMSDWNPAKIMAALTLQSNALSAPGKTVIPGFRFDTFLGDYIQLAERLPDLFNDLLDPLHEAAELTADMASGWEVSADAAKKIEETDLKPLHADVETLEQLMLNLTESMNPAIEGFQIMLAAVQEFASQIATAIVQDGVTLRSFAADMLMMVGQMLLAWGALAVITTYFTGYPGFHVAAAAIAAGLGALVAARAIGGGHQGAGGQSSPGGGGPAGSSVTYNYQFSFAGPPIGFNEASFARYIVDLQRRGERGGG